MIFLFLTFFYSEILDLKIIQLPYFKFMKNTIMIGTNVFYAFALNMNLLYAD